MALGKGQSEEGRGVELPFYVKQPSAVYSKAISLLDHGFRYSRLAG